MIELTQAEFVAINQAFDAAVRSAQSPMLAAQQLIPIALKLKGMIAQPQTPKRPRLASVKPNIPSNGADKAQPTAAQPA